MFVTNDQYRGAALLAAVAANGVADLDTVVPVLKSSGTGGSVLHTSGWCGTSSPGTLDLRTLGQLVDALTTTPGRLCTRCNNQFGDSLAELSDTWDAARDWARWLQLATETERLLQTSGSWAELRRTESPWLSAVAVARLLVAEQAYAVTHGWPGQRADLANHPAYGRLRDQSRAAAERLSGLLADLSWAAVPVTDRAAAVGCVLDGVGEDGSVIPEGSRSARDRAAAVDDLADWLVLVRRLHVDVSGLLTPIDLPAPTHRPLAVGSVLGVVNVPEFNGAGTYLCRQPAVLARVPAVMMAWMTATATADRHVSPFLPVAPVPDAADDQLLSSTQLALNAGASNIEQAAAILAAAPAALAPVA